MVGRSSRSIGTRPFQFSHFVTVVLYSLIVPCAGFRDFKYLLTAFFKVIGIVVAPVSATCVDAYPPVRNHISVHLADQRVGPSRNQEEERPAELACLLESSIVSAAAEGFDGTTIPFTARVRSVRSDTEVRWVRNAFRD